MAGISLFDKVDENYGRLDETILVARDNNFSLNSEVTTDLTYNDYEGDANKKSAIDLQNLTFNNNFTL